MNPTTSEFKLIYLEPNMRLSSKYSRWPAWKRKRNEIQNTFSKIIDNIREIVPGYSRYTESFGCHEWTPFWIAVLEVQDQFDLPGGNSDTEYRIDHNTLEITLAKE